MKKKYVRILGVVLTAVLLATLVIGTAVVPASAATLLWSRVTPPGTVAATGWAIAAVDNSVIAVSPDGGTLFAGDPVGNTVYRSTNGGTFWTAATIGLAADPVAMVVSPQYESDLTLFVATATMVYISTNGGVTFSQFTAALAGTEVYTSLAISPTYQSDGLLIAGTSDGADDTFGDCYVYGRPATFGWVALALNEDVTSVAFSPNFPTDATVLAVGSGEVAVGTRLHASVNFGAFDATIPVAAINLATELGDADVAANAIVDSDIALPSDYNGVSVLTRRVYVSTVSGVADDVYRVTMNVPQALGVLADVETLAFSGTIAAGTLIGGAAATANVYYCLNPTATAGWLWYPNTTAPTGATNTRVVLAPDFATSNRVYVGTTGAESAVSVSDDAGANFYQVGLIHTTLSAIDDVVASPAYATDSTIFMVTSDGAATTDSLWKTVNGGTSWVRVLNFVTTSDDAIVRLSPDYATDQTVYFAEQGAAAGDTSIRKSANGGFSWAAATSPVAIGDLVVESATTIYVASAAAAGGVRKSANSGWTWLTPPAGLPASALISITQAPNGDILVGTTANNVYRSTDAGVTFLIVGAVGVTATATADIVLAFDANYDTNSTIYAGDASGGSAGVYRFVIGTDTVWSQIDGGMCASCEAIRVASDGTLYATDSTIAAAAAGGIVRSLAPTTHILLVAATFEQVTFADGLIDAETLQSLSIAEGSNTLFAIDNSDGATLNRIYTYTDTLSAVSPEMVSPLPDAVSPIPGGVALSWGHVTGATSYDYAVGTRSDFIGATVTNVFAPIVNANVANLANGVTYYWRVRVNTPVLGPYSEGRAFGTQLGAAGTISPVLRQPGEWAGTTTDVSLTPLFNWSDIAGAVGYRVQVATDAAFSNILIDKVLGNVTSLQSEEELAYSTTYFWRVKAVGVGTSTDWSEAVGFTTMAKPVEPPPPVVVQETPDIVVDIPPTPEPPAPVEVTPAWIYAVIAVGAVLVIVVIVLIVRTRRAV
jgi:hypothetical protein